MGKIAKGQPINRAIYLGIEKINNGFLIIEPAGTKTWKASLNGVVKHLEQAFGVAMIEPESSPKTEVTIAEILKSDKTQTTKE